MTFDLTNYLNKSNGDRTVTTYPKGHQIYAQGEECDAVYYILDGQIKNTVLSDVGKEAVVAMQTTGDFFGEGCLTGHPKRLASVSTHVVSRILRLPTATVRKLLHDEPAFSDLFMKHLLTRNARIEADLVDQLFNNTEKRLARLLLLMANYNQDGVAKRPIPRVSQETLAEMIGTTRPRVNGFLNKFRDLGFIDYNGEIKVHSALLNVVLHD